MSGFPEELSKQLRETLIDCDPFASTAELNRVFVDERLTPWRHSLPEASFITFSEVCLLDRIHVTLRGRLKIISVTKNRPK